MDRLAVIRKHCRLGPNGQPSRCAAQRGAASDGKVIFRTRGAALRCAIDLAEWTSALLQDVYQCPDGPHFHLTKFRRNGAA